MRPLPLLKLLKSVKNQSLYPNEILIIDGSTDNKTEALLVENNFNNLRYFKVGDKERGLTKQRNYGISKVSSQIEVICFLDDDTTLDIKYFDEIIKTYKTKESAIAVGGYIINETKWYKKEDRSNFDEFTYDGLTRKLGKRYVIRKQLMLLPDVAPGFTPSFSHGYPISFLPPTSKTYQVESFMGCSMSFKRDLFHKISFSTYFEGYGLYEDLEFCLRAAKYGKLYVNTVARLNHFHDESGRPNQFKYGKMVVRNGWYIWRIKDANPSFKARIKWNATSFLLTLIRFTNVLTKNSVSRKMAFTESMGRVVGWFSVIFNSPQIKL